MLTKVIDLVFVEGALRDDIFMKKFAKFFYLFSHFTDLANERKSS